MESCPPLRIEIMKEVIEQCFKDLSSDGQRLTKIVPDAKKPWRLMKLHFL